MCVWGGGGGGGVQMFVETLNKSLGCIRIMFIVQRMPKQTKLHKNGTEKRRTRPKRKVWKRKINFRRKNFGNLEEWDPDPQMKKVKRWNATCN